LSKAGHDRRPCTTFIIGPHHINVEKPDSCEIIHLGDAGNWLADNISRSDRKEVLLQEHCCCYFLRALPETNVNPAANAVNTTLGGF
jgi:hypothetical protein